MKFYRLRSRARLAAARERLSHAFLAIRGRRFFPGGWRPRPNLALSILDKAVCDFASHVTLVDRRRLSSSSQCREAVNRIIVSSA